MDKNKLERFLVKLNLSGITNKVYIVTDENSTYSHALDENANLITKVKTDKPIFNPGENFGLYDATQFIKYLGLINETDVRYKLYMSENADNPQYYKISFAAKPTNIDYTLSSKEIIPVVKELKKEPDINFKFKITPDLSSVIIKSLDISGSKFMYFVNAKKGVFLSIGDVKGKDHVIKIKLDVELLKEMPEGQMKCFNTNYLRNILSANDMGEISVAMNGLMIFQSVGAIEASYYQRPLREKED